ncbi:MAG: Rieske (2Fe-2S) protein [Planctomycetes bacterium]|nr:Rieske (2Fe-2S) protein [Planctomycetota bacterium]
MVDANWVELGDVNELREPGLRVVEIGKRKFALSFKDGQCGLIDNVCNHVGGPLGEGKLDGDYVVCPWHHWKFHRCTGEGEPGFEEDKVPGFTLKEEGGKLFVDLNSGTNRIVGISTTAMDAKPTRCSAGQPWSRGLQSPHGKARRRATLWATSYSWVCLRFRSLPLGA